MAEDLNKRNKQEWIESAAVMKAEPFEIAGALFDCSSNALLSQGEVVQRLDAYLRPAQAETPVVVKAQARVKKTKEETINVDTKE